MSYGGLFDTENKEKRIDELEKLMNQPNFWNLDNSSEVIMFLKTKK